MVLRNRRHDEDDVADIPRGVPASKESKVQGKGSSLFSELDILIDSAHGRAKELKRWGKEGCDRKQANGVRGAGRDIKQ